MYVCLPVCLSVFMYVCLPVCLSVCLSVHLTICLQVLLNELGMELQQAKGDLGEERKKSRDLRNDLEVSDCYSDLLCLSWSFIVDFSLRAPSKQMMKWLTSCFPLEKM